VLRNQRDRAEKDLRRSKHVTAHWQEIYATGFCRCSLDGRFLEVNEAMMKMLGYESRQELLALDLAREIIQTPGDECNCWVNPRRMLPSIPSK